MEEKCEAKNEAKGEVESEGKNLSKIENYKINNARYEDMLKDKQSENETSDNILIQENYKRAETENQKSDSPEMKFDKREYINDDLCSQLSEQDVTQSVNKGEEKMDSLPQNEKKSEPSSEKERQMSQPKGDETNMKRENFPMCAPNKDGTSVIREKNECETRHTDKETNLKDYYKDLPTVIIVIGMAGSGKTTYVGSLYNYLKVEKKKKVYTMNLDPAVKYLQYPVNIDIRDSIKYHEIMKEYKLGPNGAIMTCLNLFATRFDKVIEILEKRKNKLHYIIVDTPGQIEVFNWSASGNIILETLSVSFPVVINYIIDTVRCERPITFMSNMLYACSVLYKARLPFLACFNKVDIIKHDKCIEWMKDYDSFNEDVIHDESYMASFSRSCALMINEFYEGIKTVGISSKTNEGFNSILKNLQLLKEEYINEYVTSIEKQMKRIKRKKEKDIKLKMENLLIEKQKDLSSEKNKNVN
ncbi:XPA binding protein 1 [Plasmodium coatneyi]|uniref:GPN-loop GTPase 1 n=1 Tax=Plasmodium coatneyi TaxID=208452 RepID=A0A1B1DUK6_9APIC|nr:XPA binding protein 1 [Plasmodium coatneyi]ANQ06442.1 XPA binding protein 1 [Plasmodium coatneyi]